MTTASRDKIIILSLVFAALSGFILVWLLSRLRNYEISEERSTPVSVIRPRISDLRESLVVSSVLEAGRTVFIFPRVGGTLKEILVVEGSAVSRGDLLARIDDKPYRLEMEATESVWRLAEAGLARTKRVFESSGASMQQLDEARTQRDSAYSNYELAKMNFGYTSITTPISGSVLHRYLDPGNTVSPQSALFTIGDTEVLQVRAQIPERYWSLFQDLEKIRAFLSFPAGGDDSLAARVGEIVRISPSISPEKKKFEVICELRQSEPLWPIGASLQVEFVLSESLDALSLPIRTLDGENRLWRVDPTDNTVTRIEAPSIYRDSARFAVPDAWASQVFVLEGQHRLKEGQSVEYFEE